MNYSATKSFVEILHKYIALSTYVKVTNIQLKKLKPWIATDLIKFIKHGYKFKKINQKLWIKKEI